MSTTSLRATTVGQTDANNIKDRASIYTHAHARTELTQTIEVPRTTERSGARVHHTVDGRTLVGDSAKARIHAEVAVVDTHEWVEGGVVDATCVGVERIHGTVLVACMKRNERLAGDLTSEKNPRHTIRIDDLSSV